MGGQVIVTNRQAHRDFFILETFEAGLELRGSEIKSIRRRRAQLKESFARVVKGEIFLYNVHITPYEFARRDEIDPIRPRKLLLHKKEIRYLTERSCEKGLTIVALKLYLKKGFAKVELAVAKGKKLYDKREAVKEKQARREMDRTLRRKK